MSANPTRSDLPRARRRTPSHSDASSADATTTKYAGRSWPRAIAQAALADAPTTALTMVASDSLTPGRALAPAASVPDAVPAVRARAWSPVHLMATVALVAFAVGITAQQLWSPRAEATDTAATVARTGPLETSSPRRAAASGPRELARPRAASARVEQGPSRVERAPAPPRVLNPIAEAVLGPQRATVAAAAAPPADQASAVIAELLAELDAAPPRPARTRARLRHRYARARHARR